MPVIVAVVFVPVVKIHQVVEHWADGLEFSRHPPVRHVKEKIADLASRFVAALDGVILTDVLPDLIGIAILSKLRHIVPAVLDAAPFRVFWYAPEQSPEPFRR